MDRVNIKLEADRIIIASILVKNGYTVRMGSQKREGSKALDYFVEYEAPVSAKRQPAKVQTE